MSEPVPENVQVHEQGVPLSQSLLWDLNRRFYGARGPAAWPMVPSWITTNPLTVRLYVETVLAWAIESLRGGPHVIDTTLPIEIVELGSGPGTFAFRFLVLLDDLRDIWEPLGLRFRYVVTDNVQANVDFVAHHESMRRFVAEKKVDFAVFDPTVQACPMTTSGRKIGEDRRQNPIVVIANYFFDSVPADIYRVEKGKLEAGRLTITGPAGAEAAPHTLSDLRFHYDWTEPTPYDAPVLNSILEHYRKKLRQGQLSMPTAGFRMLDHIEEWSHGRALMLVGDQGYAHVSDMEGSMVGFPVVHGHCFSVPVNLDAISRYLAAKGGSAVHNLASPHLQISLFALGAGEGAFPQAVRTFQTWMDITEPGEHLRFYRSSVDVYAHVTPAYFTTLVQRGWWDPYLVRWFSGAIIDRLEGITIDVKVRLAEALDRSWRMYWHLDEDYDLAFEYGLILFRMGRWDRAQFYFLRSLDLWGPSHSTYYNLGLCHYNEGRIRRGIAMLEYSLHLNPNYEPAATKLAELRAELGVKPAQAT